MQNTIGITTASTLPLMLGISCEWIVERQRKGLKTTPGSDVLHIHLQLLLPMLYATMYLEESMQS